MGNNDTKKDSKSNMNRLLSFGLALICVFIALLLAAFVAVSAVVLESHTYKRAARDEAYLTGVESAVIDIMKDAARENGLSKTMLMKHVQRDDIHKLAKKNASDAALVLKGSQVIYGDSFNAAALETDIYKFYEMRLPEPLKEISTTDGTSPAEDETLEPIYAEDAAPLLGKTKEDPEREALREQADKLAAEISVQIDAAVRVIDMEQIVYDHSDGSLIDWLRFMGRGGVLLPVVLLGIVLLLLYRQVWERGFSPWLAGISIGSGSALLICAMMIPVMGWMNLSIEPLQLNILCESIIHGLLAELLVMAALWFAVAYIAIRAAMGRPVSTKWLQALISKLRKAPDEKDEEPENLTVCSESPIGDDLLQTIKKSSG